MKMMTVSVLACGLLLGTAGHGFTGQAEVQPRFERPILLTSAGQSADVQLANVLLKKAGLTFRLVKLASAGDLENSRTLLLVVGASLKGLGAAGLDMAREKERVAALLAAAGRKSIPVVFLHLGGADRRGEITDALAAEYLPLAKIALVVKSGDRDGFFTRLCADRKIPLIEVEKTIDVADALKMLFKPQS
jgi:hypothetical protein